MRTLRRINPRDDSGQFAGIEAIPFGILVFVVGSLLVANAWAVVDAKFMVTTAAREAARSYVEADHADLGQARAHDVAEQVVRNHGRTPSRLNLSWDPNPPPLVRCARVTATAQYEVPALTLPFIGGYGRAFRVSSSHGEIVDPFRDGLAAGGRCG